MAATPTAVPKNKQQSFGWDVFDHAACSPDLVSSNFQTFSNPRDFFGGQCSHDEESLKKAGTNFFEKEDQEWYVPGISKLVDRYKNVSLNGNYVENLVTTPRIKFF